jgi:hypothetical protein
VAKKVESFRQQLEAMFKKEIEVNDDKTKTKTRASQNWVIMFCKIKILHISLFLLKRVFNEMHFVRIILD